MRKISLFLLLILVVILSSCTSDDDPVDSIINETKDTKEDIMNILTLYLSETRVFTVENSDTTSNDFSITFPYSRDDLHTTYQQTNEKMNFTNDNAMNLYQILNIIKEDLNETESYQEDAWKEITNSSKERICQYRLFVNNRHLIFQYYYIGPDNNIIGIHGHLSDDDQKLEYSISSIEYFYQEDQFKKISQSHFKEGEIYYEKILYHRPGGFDELTYKEYDFDQGTYKKIYLYDGDGSPVIQSVQQYSDVSSMYSEVTIRHDEIQEVRIVQYDGKNQIVYETNRENEYFNFEFNLLFVGGWSTINRYGSTNYLFSETNQLVVLSNNVFVNVKPEGSIYLSGYINNTDPSSDFNLDTTELFSTITYEELLELEDNLIYDLETVVTEAIETDCFIKEEIISDIFSLLYVEEFYGMSKDLLE